MSNDEGFKKKAYFGAAYIIDSRTRQVIITGQGRFDTENLILETEFHDNMMGEYKHVMVVLETQDGYFSPAVRFTYTSMLMGTSTRREKMDSCFHWPKSKGVEYFLSSFDSLSLQIKSQHANTVFKRIKSEGKSEESEELTITSIRKAIGAASYKNFTVEVNSGYGSSFSHDRVDDEAIIRQRISFKITNSNGAIFDIDGLMKALQGFKMYWIASHDLIDCEFTYIHLGNEVSFMMQNNKLAAATKNVEGYRAAISLDTPLQLEYFAKILHFYFNLSNDKRLGSRSKVGLAMNRVVGHRYREEHRGIDYWVIDLVFALQGLAESVAQREIKKQNKDTKAQTIEGIEKVQQAIKLIESDIPDGVKTFYTKSIDAIYAAISRPTFAQSIKITAEKLVIDLSAYEQVLNDIEKARQQVVHSENYDPIFLIDLLTKGTTKIEKSDDGRTMSMAIGVRKGSLDHLYDLVVLLLRKYIGAYNE